MIQKVPPYLRYIFNCALTLNKRPYVETRYIQNDQLYVVFVLREWVLQSITIDPHSEFVFKLANI